MLKRLRIDPYLLALAGTVLAATLFPATGTGTLVASRLTYGVICLLFFLYGARLAPKAILSGLSHWRLQLAILATTFLVFPLLGAALRASAGAILPEPLVVGLVFVCLLPSTVQSSIAFTSIARGNVPAALCAASVSNLLGVAATPLLVGLVLSAHAEIGFEALADIAVQLLLPFAAGQLARPLIGPFLHRHKRLTSTVDRASILFVVYSAFSAGMAAGIWGEVGLGDLAIVLLLDTLLLAAVLAFTTLSSRGLGFSREDEIAIVFCGSKKSMASGIPMANVLFPGASVAMVVLPLLLFHQIQLFACAFLAQRYGARPQAAEAVLAEPSV